MFTVRKKFRIEMAHQLASAVTAPCYETIHGHSYVIEIFISSPTLNKDSMVVDFGALGAIKGIVNQFDHALCIPAEFADEYKDMLARYNKHCFFTEENPTAEWLAKVILDRCQFVPLLPGCWVSKVRVHETETGYAEVDSVRKS